MCRCVLDATQAHNCRIDKELGKCMLIKLSSYLRAFKLHIKYPKESRDLTPYSESPVQALQELNRVSRAETDPLKETLVPRRRPTVAEIITVVCWSVYCCHSDACPRDRTTVLQLLRGSVRRRAALKSGHFQECQKLSYLRNI
jgi:hypothetical protein